jgi:hypothetical protein
VYELIASRQAVLLPFSSANRSYHLFFDKVKTDFLVGVVAIDGAGRCEPIAGTACQPWFSNDGQVGATPNERLKNGQRKLRTNHRIFRIERREVVRISSESGATCYLTNVPPDAVALWHRRLRAELKRPVARSRRLLGETRRREFTPVRERPRRHGKPGRLKLTARRRPLAARR